MIYADYQPRSDAAGRCMAGRPQAPYDSARSLTTIRFYKFSGYTTRATVCLTKI
jgi:hypothetical protein